MIPASTLKILTAAAALEVLGPDRTFETRVVMGATPGALVLVGGGDPTLTVDDRPEMPAATRLATLADATAAALTNTGTTTVRLLVDDTLFSGPAVDPDWRTAYVTAGVVGPVTALAVDGGRRRPDTDQRSADPTLAAAAAFAAMLTDRGITVTAEPFRTDAARGAVEVASVRSPSLSVIVEHVLAESDNDGAEVLARHVSHGMGGPASSEAAGAAVVEAITELGIDMSLATIADGSGLARGNAVPAVALTATLAAAADPEHPNLRAVLTGLPVAGFTGTLGDRFESASAAGTAGVVRAKTGTLTGVSSLAGLVVARDGTTYGFAVLADEIDSTVVARSALDEVAAALAACGCAVSQADPAPVTEPSASRSVAS
jgi:D-alanyl-D-alanine carboxypeptidase/D-alanyl-D-alanine-endopeptidase (penicillin-binding protein 4)